MESNDFIISENSTIYQALQKLNSLRDVSRLTLFVASKNGIVIGSLTDGDIRRSLVKDKDLDIKIGKICARDFVYKFDSQGYIDLSSIRKDYITMLPLLNKDKTLSRIIDLKKTKSILPVECMIMAGGRGKRMSPLTDSIPKPMLPLGNKPIIEHNIDRLISFGIKKIYISVKYLGEQIETYFGDGSKKGVRIDYIREDKPLGTAGALSMISRFNTEQILLINSDLFTNVDFEKMYKNLIDENADMVVASTEHMVDIPYAVFEIDDNRVTALKEKPSYSYRSNAGIYMLKNSLVSKIPKNTYYDITDLMEELVAENRKLLHCPIRGYWIDIGSSNDYKKAKDLIKYM